MIIKHGDAQNLEVIEPDNVDEENVKRQIDLLKKDKDTLLENNDK